MKKELNGVPFADPDDEVSRNEILNRLLEPPAGLDDFTVDMMLDHCKTVITIMYANEGQNSPSFDHEPMLLIGGRGGLTLMPIGEHLNSDEGKDSLMALIRKFTAHEAVQFVAMTLNAYTLRVDPNKDIAAQRGTDNLAWHPERIEIVQVACESRNGDTQVIRWEVTRDETSTTITPMEISPKETVSGRLTGFFKPNQE